MKKTLLLVAALAATFATANALTYNVTVPTGTNACYIAGDMNSWSFTEMTKVDDTHYSITLDAATESHGYKYSSGPDWAYEELDNDGKAIGNRSHSTSDVVAKWKAVYSPDAPTVYSIKHPWKDGADGSWSYKELTDNGDGTYSVDDYYGGKGCNWKSNKSGEKWIENPTLVGNPAVGDAARFTLSDVDGDGAITITKLDGGDGEDSGDGGDSDDPASDIIIRVQIPEGLSSWEYTVAPNLYYWTTETDGKFAEMTLADGWYSYTVNAATVNFIVVNGSSWDALSSDSRRQSVDVKGVTASGCYILGNGTEIEGNGDTWKKTVTATDCNGSGDGGDSDDPASDITIRVQIPEELSSWDYSVTPNLYYWTTGDGKFAEMTLADGWYSCTVNAATVNFIVVNGSSWDALSSDSRRQSVDVKGVTASGCYILGNGTEIEGNGDTWKKTVTATDCNSSTALDNPEMANIYATNGRIENIGTARIYTVTGLDVTSLNGSLQGIYIVKVGDKAHKIAVK